MYNNYNPMGTPGFQYQQQAQARCTQPLTHEQIKQLRNKGAAFTLQADPTDILKSICTHKENGNFTLMENGDGTVSCSICGETFSLLDVSKEEVENATNIVKDVLQSIKTYYLDIPEETAKNYFPIIPLIDKIPQLYVIAMNNFKKYDGSNMVQQNNNPYGFGMLNMLTSPMMPMNGMYQQPQMGFAPQQQMMPGYMPQQPMGYAPQQPVQMPNYGQPQQMPGYNPFGYNPAPMTQQPAAPAQAPAQQPAPAADNNGTVVNNKTFSA